MFNYIWVIIGGGLGSALRFWASGLAARLFGETFPWGTLTVNVTGSLFIGFFAAITGPDGRWIVSGPVRTFVMVGICGGYTTFSSFSLQTLNLASDGEWLYAAANAVLSLVLCLLAVWAGHAAASLLNPIEGH